MYSHQLLEHALGHQELSDAELDLNPPSLLLDEANIASTFVIYGSARIPEPEKAEILLDLETFETEHKTYPMLTAELGERVGDVTEARFKG